MCIRDRRYYVTHGDIFDRVTTQMKWLARLGDAGYTFLLWAVSYTHLTGAAQPLDAQRIFERFYQGKKKEGSTGLGLAIADAICKMRLPP